MRGQKGITLIALVITIIVLLILAGVSIAMLTGQNGLLTKANSSSTKTQAAEAKENVETAISACYAKKLADDPLSEVKSLDIADLVDEINATTASTDATAGTGDAINFKKKFIVNLDSTHMSVTSVTDMSGTEIKLTSDD